MDADKPNSEQNDKSSGASSDVERQGVAADKDVEKLPQPATKPTKKQRLVHELRDVGITIGYLAASLSILETYKSLILLQLGINEFQHNLVFALVEAIALGKIVAIAQNLPFLKACNRHSLFRAVLYQAVVMTLITDVGGKIEDVLFPRSATLLSQSGAPLVLAITHQLGAMVIFSILFTVKGLDEALGPGKLWRLVFCPPDSRK